MNILVVGATGGSGRAAVKELLGQGHTVTAFVRQTGLVQPAAGLRVFGGDVMHQDDVDRAVAHHDAVIVTLGIRENPLLVRLRGSADTPMQIRSVGTAHVIEAMRRRGVSKLVVQSSYGVGETRDRLPLKWRLIFALLLKPQIADTEQQERLVRESGLTWVLAQPVALTDDNDPQPPFASASGEVHSMSIARRRVALFLAAAATTGTYDRQSVAIS
jgi:nucleoside-diphosphate-sugar epimerase